MIADAMDLVHENSISAIALLQSRFQEQSTLMFMISNLFDPRYAFLFYAPLLYSLDRYTGRKIMWVAVIAEWSNQILKWILHGERPYWWIHETLVYSNTTLPDVQQFKVTCETGPGSPSGHAMVTASVWYILIEALLKHQSSESKGNIFSKIAWAIYTIILAAVSLSRIYIAAHFPHQCVLGGIIGVAVAILVSNLNTDHMSRRAYIMGSLGLFLSAMTTYAVLRMFGMNPMWSVDRALKWCAKREYVHLDTTPFFSMMRYTGFFLGMGIGLTSQYTHYVSKVHFNMSTKIVCAILAVGLCKLYELIKLPMDSTLVFYSLAMASHAILSFILVALVPYFVARISSLKVKSN